MKSLISYLSKLQFNKHFNRVIKAEILEIRHLQESRKEKPQKYLISQITKLKTHKR